MSSACVSCCIFPSLSEFHRTDPGGLRPRAVGEKQKRRAGQSLHSARRGNLPHATQAQGTSTAKPPFTKKAGLSYNIPCGAAGRPLCRWFRHLRRLAGVGAPASCRIFVFHVDYNRVRGKIQALFTAGAGCAPSRRPCSPRAGRWSPGRGNPPTPPAEPRPGRRPPWGTPPPRRRSPSPAPGPPR